MKSIITCAAAAFAVVILTGMGGATITINDNFVVPFPHVVVNPCNGEVIAMTGNVHVSVHGVIAPNGNVTMTFHQNFNGISGTGDLGNTYQCVSAITQTSTGSVGETFTFTGTQSLIGHGNAPNSYLRAVVHMTVNANGDVTVDNFTLTTSCGS